MKVVVGKVSDFANGDRKIIDVNGKSIGVFRVDDQFYAIRNRCPHQFGPLCVGDARAAGGLRAAPATCGWTPGPPLIACPWHGWEYDLATGQSFMGPGRGNMAALSYEVSVLPGSELAADAGSRPRPDGRIPGPYVAETVPVSVEQDYVVVDDSPARRGNRGEHDGERSHDCGQTRDRGRETAGRSGGRGRCWSTSTCTRCSCRATSSPPARAVADAVRERELRRRDARVVRDYPRWRNGGFRIDAAVPGGGPAGSDLDLLRTQLLEEYDTDIAILIPLTFGFGGPAAYKAALCRAINDWLAEEWLDRDPRLRGQLQRALRLARPRGRGDRALRRATRASSR